MRYFLILVVFLGGCALTTNVHMKCDGKCQLDAGRDISLEQPK